MAASGSRYSKHQLAAASASDDENGSSLPSFPIFGCADANSVFWTQNWLQPVALVQLGALLAFDRKLFCLPVATAETVEKPSIACHNSLDMSAISVRV